VEEKGKKKVMLITLLDSSIAENFTVALTLKDRAHEQF
jgi:hypothetical protein